MNSVALKYVRFEETLSRKYGCTRPLISAPDRVTKTTGAADGPSVVAHRLILSSISYTDYTVKDDWSMRQSNLDHFAVAFGQHQQINQRSQVFDSAQSLPHGIKTVHWNFTKFNT